MIRPEDSLFKEIFSFGRFVFLLLMVHLEDFFPGVFSFVRFAFLLLDDSSGRLDSITRILPSLGSTCFKLFTIYQLAEQ